MATEVAYDPGLNSFNHDRSRGKWPKSTDFLFACIGHAIKMDAVLVMPSAMFESTGIYAIVFHLLLLGVYMIPFVLIQSFLGQFSSTGFISALRISPLFKGIGYIGLVINLICLTYLGVYGAIPLFYFFQSFKSTLPWSCVGANEWMRFNPYAISPCHVNYTVDDLTPMQIPSMEFFRSHLNIRRLHREKYATFSDWLMLCTFAVWFVVGIVLIQPIERIARFLRWTCVVMMVILGLCVVRLAFLPGAFSATMDVLFGPKEAVLMDVVTWLPLMALSALGPGWGTILTMASFNKFQEDTVRNSWLLCLALSGVMFGLGFMGVFVIGFLQKVNPDELYIHGRDFQLMEFLIIPSALEFLEFPRIWCWIFLIMLLLGSLNLLTVQLMSVLTSMFDEFQRLRAHKRSLTLIAVGALALSSIPFCTNVGLKRTQMVSMYLMVHQYLLNLLLLLVVLWIYGRERFQRDISFMTDVVFATWRVYVMKFVSPLFMLTSLYMAYFAAMMVLNFEFTTCLGIALLLWLPIPVYCCFRLIRVKQCKRAIQPTDWYPAGSTDRQKYEQNLNGGSYVLTSTTPAGV